MTESILNCYGKPVILASKSPRREEILKLAGFQFQIHASNYHEPGIEHERPENLVQTHAYHKSKDIAGYYDDAWIIGADTIVLKDQIILEKPRNRDDAISMLSLLSGATHQVFTGYCVMNSQNGSHFTDVERTDVTFRELSSDIIEHYVDNYHPFDKAGSYGIQDYSAIFVYKIDGCFYNVVGFPIAKFFQQIHLQLKSLL